MSGSQSAALGNWITQNINGMQYDVLLPANYDPSIKYPTMLFLHQLDMGNDPVDLLNWVNGWFNTTQFRTDHPAVVVMPLLDQSADSSGQTINFGGVSTADNPGELNAIAALKAVLAQYSTDPSRVYVTGASMGGIGTEDMMIKFDAHTGTEGKIFAAGLSMAGADYGQGYPQPNQSVVTALKNVPLWAIHGGQDTQVPLAWDQNLYAAEQAIGGIMKYTQDNSLGHDVWDTYYPKTGSDSPLSWLFSQSTGGTGQPSGGGTVTPPKAAPSANDTVVKAGSTAAIVDAAGNKWTITSAGQVAVNGTADTTTANVAELAYVDGKVWQENSSSLWWAKASPAEAWGPAAGTATSPLPAAPPPVTTPPVTTPPKVTPSANDTVVKAGSTAAVVDAAGNKWTITSTGQVAVNGTADTTTGNVTELAYVDGKVWQENSSSLWWAKAKPTDAWGPAAGTAASPLPAAPPPVTTPPVTTPPATPASGVIGSGSDTIVLTMSEDADGPAGAAGRDAQFTLNVDGKQIGGLQTVTAAHSAGKTQTFTFQGNYAPGQHAITITFANNSMTAGDKAAFADGGDRNLYINSVTYDGTKVSSAVTPIYQSPGYPPLVTGTPVTGNAVFKVTDATTVPANAPSTPTTTPASVSAGTGPDTLTLSMSEDPYQGDAQFTVSVDGKQVGSTLTTKAVEWQGQTQQFVLHGSWGKGAHTVSVAFVNDLIGPPDAEGGYDPVDRNLMINAITYDGAAVPGAPYALYNNGSKSFTVAATTTTPPATPTASADYTVVKAGSTAAITDAAGNKWTVTGTGQAAVNGVADATTANVTELAYVSGKIWQENSSNLWWDKAKPGDAWSPAAGTSTSPLTITIAATQATVTVSQSQVSVIATAGDHMVFITGTGDTISLTGGKDTITDSRGGNTVVLPAAGKGYDTFAGTSGSNILTLKDTLDLRPALKATDWNGAALTLAKYVTATDTAQGAILSIAPASGGAGVAVATIGGATNATLSDLLPHMLT